VDSQHNPRISELLPEGYVPLDYVVAVEALNEEGEVVLITCSSPSLTPWKHAGMLTSALDDVRDSLRGGHDANL